MKPFSVLKYLVAVAVIMGVIGIGYDAVLQAYRANANHARVKAARATNTNLLQDKPVDNFFTGTVDIGQDLAPVPVRCNTGWRACPLIMLP